MTKPKTLIDCDPGHDDAVAILFAARHLELVVVTTEHGNNTTRRKTSPKVGSCAGNLR